MCVNVTKCTKNTSSPDLTPSDCIILFNFVPQVKILPLFSRPEKFQPVVGGQTLEMENILVYYVDEEPPTFTMQNLSGGIIAVIVVVVLAVVIGLLVLVSTLAFLCVSAGSVFADQALAVFSPQFFLRKRDKKRYNKTQVSLMRLVVSIAEVNFLITRHFSSSIAKRDGCHVKSSSWLRPVCTSPLNELSNCIGSVPFLSFN